ncbi:MAG: 7-cyano-7-deazaguanine reductase [Anaerolineae bacterium]|nr:7-cyano-7-deazaguanine reductase [Anaerolineae bacterium]
MSEYSALGKPVTKFERLDQIPTPCQSISYHSDQLVSACPVTGQTDFYDVTIDLDADGIGIETKTLKLYLETYQGKRIFCEDLAVTICQDIFNASHPLRCAVTLVQRRRGGIQITARHELKKS